MKNRHIFYSIAGVLAALALLDGAVSLYTAADTLSDPLDLTNVSKIRVNGTAGIIRISAGAEGPLVAQLKGERRGWGALWNSSWFSDACPANGSMRVDGNTLNVTLGAGPRLYDWSNCTLTLTANLPEDAAVLVDQQAARTELTGNFSVVDVRSDAGDMWLEGHAQAVSVSGAALRARLAFDKVTQTETINLSGRMLDAGVAFMQPTEVSYLVEATASYVDSDLPNTPGAMPEIRIRGEMVNVRIE